MSTQTLKQRWIALNKILTRKKINLRKIQTRTREILSWFSLRDLHPVLKQPAWDFSYPDFDTPKINSLYTTWQNNLYQICTTLLYTKKTTICTTLFCTKKTLLYNSSLWMITKYPISLETCMWSWIRFLIGELSEFFTMELELCEMKVKTNFLENKIFQQSLDRKTNIFN